MLPGEVGFGIDLRILFPGPVNELQQGLGKAGIGFGQQLGQTGLCFAERKTPVFLFCHLGFQLCCHGRAGYGVNSGCVFRLLRETLRRRCHSLAGCGAIAGGVLLSAAYPLPDDPRLQVGDAFPFARKAVLLKGLFPDVIFIDEAGHALKQLFRQLESVPAEHHQVDLHFIIQQKFADGIHGDLQCQGLGEAVIARRDQREGNRPAPVPLCQLQAPLVAGAQQLFFAVAAVLPHRAHSVDHIPCRQVKGRGDGRVAHADLADLLPRFQQLWPCLPVDSRVHAIADLRPGVGRVHNGVHGHIDNIVSHDLKGHNRPPSFSSAFL